MKTIWIYFLIFMYIIIYNKNVIFNSKHIIEEIYSIIKWLLIKLLILCKISCQESIDL